MKNVWKIIFRDFCRIRSNVIAIVVLIGLTIVPSLYAWFNIAASWDPYGNTSNLKVAVANIDEGYKGGILSLNINLGETVQSSLRENTQLHWIFTNKEDAVDGVKSGKYYAAIVIPEDFTKDMLSLFSSDVHFSKIQYYLNEKENAIAPKVTDKGASAIQRQIDEIFAQTVAQAGLGILDAISTETEQADVKNAVTNLLGNLEKLSNNLRAASTTLDAFVNLTASMEKALDTSSAFLEQSGEVTREAASELNTADSTVEGLKDVFSQTSEQMEKVLRQGSDWYGTISSQVDILVDGISSGTQTAQDDLNSLAEDVQDMTKRYTDVRNSLSQIAETLPGSEVLLQPILTALDDSIATQKALSDKLIEAGNGLANTGEDLENDQDQLKNLALHNQDMLLQIQSQYQSQVQEKTDDLVALLQEMGGQTSGILEQVGVESDKIIQAADQAVSESGKMRSALEQSIHILNEAADKIDATRAKLLKDLENGQIQTIKDFLGNSPDVVSTFLSAPVKMETNALYPVENYGSAMAPFYTVLSIWVGGIVLAAMLKTSVSEQFKKELPNRKEWQIYLGRYGLFLGIGLAQTTLICLGDLYFLRIQCEHPFFFLLAGWFTSIVFVNIIYTLTVSFGDIGKAICVILLVMQVAGSGGTFPIEVAPPFFQRVYPLLPFTHAMSAMRETVAGFYGNTYWFELGTLSIFLILSLAIGLVLRKPLIKANIKFMEKLEDTKLM